MGGEKLARLYSSVPVPGSPPRERGKGKARNAVTHQLRITPAWAGKSLFCFTAAVPIQDHPRMGGEKLRLLTLLLILPGSPPHGRGKATAEYQAAMDTGITPAWAGKSLGFMLWQIWRLGSPPHGRGKVCTCCCASPLARITPAWAGKRVKPQWAACAAQDHPRMGGEKALMPENRLIMEGSPPHGRGKALNVQKVEKQGRITPAWAGKRSPLTASKPTFWDHPRMGGEKYDCTGQEFTNWGSPPRRRGKEQPHH